MDFPWLCVVKRGNGHEAAWRSRTEDTEGEMQVAPAAERYFGSVGTTTKLGPDVDPGMGNEGTGSRLRLRT